MGSDIKPLPADALNGRSTGLAKKTDKNLLATLEGAAERFWAKVCIRPGTECWPWLACRNPRGQGLFFVCTSGGKQVAMKAPRVAWMLMTRAAPQGPVLHTCANASCVNPSHLTNGLAGRFWRHVARSGALGELDCWLWKGSLDWRGNIPAFRGPERIAYRMAWVLERGAIPEGVKLHRTCGSRLCVNPAHRLLKVRP
jgi:hypothetical protein